MAYDQNGNWTGGWIGEAIDETTKRREGYQATEKWLVDPIFPSGAMHLIGGPSGSGKTTWLLQQLHEWDQGLPLFGRYKSNPVPWVYIGCDRSLRETDKTLQRLGYHDWKFEAYALEDLLTHVKDAGMLKVKESPSINQHILAKFPDIELFVIEGLQALMPDMERGRSQNKAELLWALSLRLNLEPVNKTIIATTHSPKVTQAGGVAQDARSKFLGSQGFIGTCSTMVGFEKDENRPQQRKVKIMGRNFPDIDQIYSLDERGKFVLESEGEVGEKQTPVETAEDRDTQILIAASQLLEFTVDEMAASLKWKVSKYTVLRDLAKLAQSGSLKVRKEGRKFVFTYPPSSVQ